MTDYIFDGIVALNPATGLPEPNGTGQVYALADTGLTTPLTVRSLSGITTTTVTSGPLGAVTVFVTEDHPRVRWVSGGQQIVLTSFDGLLADAIAARQAAIGALTELQAFVGEHEGIDFPAGGAPGNVLTLDSAGERRWLPPTEGGGGSGIAGAPSIWPTEFKAAEHTHPSSQINDTTTLGRNLMKALDQADARRIMGAGTGNGSSNLRLGTSSSDAAPGDHTHSAGAIRFTPGGGITAEDLQTAVLQAAAMGGGGSGTSEVMVVTYRSGAYPSLPSTKPTGVKLVQFLGPVQPTGLPSWIGLGASQVPSQYSPVATS